MSDFDPLADEGHEQGDPANAERARFDALEEAEDLKWLMSEVRGRRIAWRLLTRAGVFRLSYTGEPISTTFREGERNVGLRLLAEINTHCPELYALMAQERKNDGRRTDQHSAD